MTSATFVHVSDIHFGQEKGDRVHVHGDVRLQLVADAAMVVRDLAGGRATGILVTGDVAHSGAAEQYQAAGEWLDALATAVGCGRPDVQIIPGNHDVDRSATTIGAGHLLNDIRAGDADAYERIMSSDGDRASLFSRLENFDRFSTGYDCSLDAEGRCSSNLRVELAPGRSIRFHRMNSALLCTGNETESDPELRIGSRQFTIRPVPGEEAVVLVHHPLRWCRDEADATRYLRHRARVLISGHEHTPAVEPVAVEPGADLLMVAAGATTPFKSSDAFAFTYNVLAFAWDEASDGLAVTIHPRAWNPVTTRFEPDDRRLGGRSPSFVLGCPGFRAAASPTRALPEEATAAGDLPAGAPAAARPENASGEPTEPVAATGPVGAVDSPEGRLLLLRFFRDLTEGERLGILLALGALDRALDEPITRELERRLFDWTLARGRMIELTGMVEDAIVARRGGGTT